MSNKSIKKSYILNMVYQVLALVVPFIMTPYVAHVLSVAQIGIYNYTFSIANIFMNFIINGTSSYGLFETAYNRDRKKSGKLICEITIIKCIVFLIVLIPYFVIVFASSEIYRCIFLVNLILLVGYICDITWFYQGFEEFERIVFRNILVKMLSVVCILLFVKSEKDFLIYVMINVLSLFAGNVTLWIGIRKKADFTRPLSLSIIRHIRPSLVFFVPTLASSLYAYVDKILLGALSTESEVAFYSQSEKVVKMTITVITAMQTVLMPRISNLLKNSEMEQAKYFIHRGVKFVFCIGMPMMFGMVSISKYFVPIFFGNGYERSILNIQILSLLVMAIGLSSIIGTSVMIPIGKQKQYNCIIIVAAIANCVLDILLIPRLQSYGASVATVTVEMFILLSIWVNIRKILDIRTTVKQTYKYLIGAVLMFFVLQLSKRFYSVSIISIILIASGIYFIFLVMIRDEFLNQVVGILGNRIRKR